MVTHTRNWSSAFNPSKCTHTQQWVVNTHTVNTHLEQWAAIAPAPGEQLGVRCLVQGHLSHGIEGGESAVHSQSPPSIPAGARIKPVTSGYKPNSLTARPQLFGYQHSSEYLLLCSAEERSSYRFGTTRGGVNDDRIFILGERIWYDDDDVLRFTGYLQISQTLCVSCCSRYKRADGSMTSAARSVWSTAGDVTQSPAHLATAREVKRHNLNAFPHHNHRQ